MCFSKQSIAGTKSYLKRNENTMYREIMKIEITKKIIKQAE